MSNSNYWKGPKLKKKKKIQNEKLVDSKLFEYDIKPFFKKKRLLIKWSLNEDNEKPKSLWSSPRSFSFTNEPEFRNFYRFFLIKEENLAGLLFLVCLCLAAQTNLFLFCFYFCSLGPFVQWRRTLSIYKKRDFFFF